MNDEKKEITEIELKLALPSFCDYLKLIGFIGEAEECAQQRNIFYDTKNRDISNIGYALRLRTESCRGIVTLKSTTVQKGKVAIRKEIEEAISLYKAIEVQENQNIFSLDIAPIIFLNSKLDNLKTVLPILQFDNERIIKKIHLNKRTYTFEIDKTTYNDGRVDYELEVELESIEKIEDAEMDFQKLFKSLEIEFLIQKKSKFERALEIAGMH